MTDELLDLVDENDNVIGEVWKSEAHKGNTHIHREVGVIIVNSQNEFLLQQRSENKRYPLMWVIAAGGHCGKGESPENAAHRELREELGFDTELKFIEKTVIKNQKEHFFANWFVGEYNAEVTDVNFLKDEVKQVKFFSIGKFTPEIVATEDDINNDNTKNKISPATNAMCRKIFEKMKNE